MHRVRLDQFLSNVLVRRPSTNLSKQSRTLVWLHGLGQSTQGLMPLLEMCCPPSCTLVVPIAPLRAVAARQGRDFHAWFDIAAENPELDQEDNEEFEGLSESKRFIEALIERESQFVDSKDIVLAGFQQGGAVALHVGLNYKNPLKAICSFNGYVLPSELESSGFSPANQDTLVVAMNAEDDENINIKFAEDSFSELQKIHPKTQFQVDFTPTGKGKMISHESIHHLASIMLS
jgi:phospholipase/carboxylesterase